MEGAIMEIQLHSEISGNTRRQFSVAKQKDDFVQCLNLEMASIATFTSCVRRSQKMSGVVHNVLCLTGHTHHMFNGTIHLFTGAAGQGHDNLLCRFCYA